MKLKGNYNIYKINNQHTCTYMYIVTEMKEKLK